MIIVSPLHQLDEAIARWRPSHGVSLASPGGEPPSLPPGLSVLRLLFHDIAELRPGLRAVTKAQMRAIADFGRDWDASWPLVVHCWAGVSRSPAAAYVIACARDGPGSERERALQLRRAAPFATPNARMTALADAVLERNGAMISAISDIGRGADVGLGACFVLT